MTISKDRFIATLERIAHTADTCDADDRDQTRRQISNWVFGYSLALLDEKDIQADLWKDLHDILQEVQTLYNHPPLQG